MSKVAKAAKAEAEVLNELRPGQSVELLAASEYFDVPTNPKAKVHDLVKPYQSAKLINFDFNWAGSTTVRQQLVDRFTNDILAGRKIS